MALLWTPSVSPRGRPEFVSKSSMYQSIPISFGPLGVQRQPISSTMRSMKLTPRWPVIPWADMVFGWSRLRRERGISKAFLQGFQFFSGALVSFWNVFDRTAMSSGCGFQQIVEVHRSFAAAAQDDWTKRNRILNRARKKSRAV
jgi:hypothetical protein